MQPDYNQPEIAYVTAHKISCNGGGGALGHPLTYYIIGEEGFVDCSYCDKRFIFKE
jgi:uncharacterized Zn-finger protein